MRSSARQWPYCASANEFTCPNLPNLSTSIRRTGKFVRFLPDGKAMRSAALSFRARSLARRSHAHTFGTNNRSADTCCARRSRLQRQRRRRRRRRRRANVSGSADKRFRRRMRQRMRFSPVRSHRLDPDRSARTRLLEREMDTNALGAVRWVRRFERAASIGSCANGHDYRCSKQRQTAELTAAD